MNLLLHKDEIAKEIFRIYDFGYHEIFPDEDKAGEEFCNNFKKEILDRTAFLFDIATHVVIEEEYVENEWKEMISYHYINTTYNNRLKPNVIRVHLLCADTVTPQSYLGFFTLRPFPELQSALSFIYANWGNAALKAQLGDTAVMTYPKKVHVNGTEIVMDTYPFFAQDSIVTCCVDANILMASQYLAGKHGFKKLRISDIRATFFTKIFLPRNVNPSLMERIFINNRIPFKRKTFARLHDADGKFWTNLKEKIDAYIGSGLPVMLAFDHHVVQLIGHIGSDVHNQNYIVYDDSGHFASELNVSDGEKREKVFCYNTSFAQIQEYLLKKNVSDLIIGICEYERVYLEYSNYKTLLAQYIEYYNNLYIEKDYGSLIDTEIVKGEKIASFKENVKIRSVLVENNELKEFLKQNIEAEIVRKQVIEDIEKNSLPHYLWYSEIDCDNGMLCAIGDPTMHYRTKNHNQLFLQVKPFSMKTRIKLLT